MAEKETEKPFLVTTNTGVFRSGHETLEQATFACREANELAMGLGIETRYEVKATKGV